LDRYIYITYVLFDFSLHYYSFVGYIDVLFMAFVLWYIHSSADFCTWS